MRKKIIDFEKYEISDEGYVYNTCTERIQKQKIAGRGYPQVSFWKDGKRYYRYIHRLVAEYFIENPNNYDCVNHKDGNKLNNNVNNLEWCTNKQNMRHAFEKGLQPSGELRSTSKLKLEDILFIYDNYKSIDYVDLAKMFDVSYSTIQRVYKGKRYKNIYRQYRDKYNL